MAKVVAAKKKEGPAITYGADPEFFAFNKQAFCNYYHLVIGALCCAAGVSNAPPKTAA